jgi:hypothetical protein
MENFCFDLTAIVVGSRRHTAIQQITNVFTQKNIVYEYCENIYSALAFIGKVPAGANVIVIGNFVPLTADTVRFFSLTPKYVTVKFCCIAEKLCEPMQSILRHSAKNDVIFINRAEQLLPIIQEYRISNDIDIGPLTNGKDFASRISLIADNFFLTEAEQNALLGDKSDESFANTE